MKASVLESIPRVAFLIFHTLTLCFFMDLEAMYMFKKMISLQSPISALNFLCCYILAKVAFTGMKRCISSQISLEFAFTSKHICKDQVNPGQDAVA